MSNNVFFPSKFSFDKTMLSSELAEKETNGYPENQYEKEKMSPADLAHLDFLESQTVHKRHEYELYAMIVHHGFTSRRGHYYALARHANGDWLKFDDELVTLIDSQEKLEQIS